MKFLLDDGYKHWDTETVKGLDGYIEFFQKRMDKDEAILARYQPPYDEEEK